MTTELLAALESLRIAPNSEAVKFVWSYAQRNGHADSKAPTACAAILPDFVADDKRDGEHKIVGFGVGFSYCSDNDVPNRARGRRLAVARCLVAINTTGAKRSRYGQAKTAFNGNGEPYQTGHVKFTYVPCCVLEEALVNIKALSSNNLLPDDIQIAEGVARYIANGLKHGKL